MLAKRHIQENLRSMAILLDCLPENYELQVFRAGTCKGQWVTAFRQDQIDYPYQCRYRIALKGSLE